MAATITADFRGNSLDSGIGLGVEFPHPPSVDRQPILHFGSTGAPRTPTKKLDNAPPMLSAGRSCVAEIPGDWFLVHCRSHHEKSLAWQLGEQGFDYYLPLTLVRKKTASRNRVTLVVPLFDGYLFSAAPRESDGTTNNLRLTNFLLDHQHVFIDEYWGRVKLRDQLVSDLSIVEAALAQNPSLEARSVQRVGQPVRVLRGPWLGSEGIVDEIDKGRDKRRVWMTIETLGRAVPLDVDQADLELA